MKVPDNQVVPHCRKCHAAWETRSGRFKGMTRDRRYDLAAKWVAATILAATPEDLDQAEEMERFGLGRIEWSGGPPYDVFKPRRWHWLPLQTEETHG